ncbi:MAG TPA: MBL fold metallo-hydrolase [Gammaproteobacteria bacterium]|nr:MBL fold metallo-hydrolase [Gammaproteobacteria bacterium]
MRIHRFLMIVTALGLAAAAGSASAQPQTSRVNPRNDLSTMTREPFKVFDNLYFVGQGEVASYVITTSEGHILIDTMWDLPGYLEYLLNNIRKVGLRPVDIRYVLILQGHRDHYMGAVALKDVLDVQWGAAAADWELIERDLGEYAPPRDIVIEEGDTLTLGDLTIRFEITPGHTPGTVSMRLPVYDNGTRHNAYFHGGTALRLDDPAIIREFIADSERIKGLAQSGDIDVQIVNHYDITPYGAPTLFERAELLQERRPGEPHPWVRPGEIVRLMDELIADARSRLP